MARGPPPASLAQAGTRYATALVSSAGAARRAMTTSSEWPGNFGEDDDPITGTRRGIAKKDVLRRCVCAERVAAAEDDFGMLMPSPLQSGQAFLPRPRPRVKISCRPMQSCPIKSGCSTAKAPATYYAAVERGAGNDLASARLVPTTWLVRRHVGGGA